MPLFDECHYAECHHAECDNAKHHNAECHYTKCHIQVLFAECHYAECHHMNDIMLSIVVPNVTPSRAALSAQRKQNILI
jgi:hypothetical protein